MGSAAGAQPARTDSLGAAAAVEQFHAALAAADSARAVAVLADDALIMEGGAIQTKSDYLGGHLAGDMKASQGAKGERTVLKVTVVGHAAYIASRTVTPPTGAQGSTGSELAELMVLSKVSGSWKIRAVHWSSRRRRPGPCGNVECSHHSDCARGERLGRRLGRSLGDNRVPGCAAVKPSARRALASLNARVGSCRLQPDAALPRVRESSRSGQRMPLAPGGAHQLGRDLS